MLTQFGNYLLDEPLATGGMARVYRARLRGLGGFEKPLVVKQVLPELASDRSFVDMFVREANTLVRMSHPHIVSVYELGVVDGVYFLAMEYVEGATIAAILQGGALEPPLVAQLAVQVCDALEYAHGRFGILHRDLSPRNIIVDGTGHARLLDFGVSAHVDSTDHTAFGSPGYMSPEQARGEATTVRSDLFSLGTVLFEALQGEPAFLRGDRQTTKRALLEEPVPSLDPSRTPQMLVDLVGRLLERDPARRPASAHEVARELRTWLSQHAPQGVSEALVERVEQAREDAAAQRTAPATVPTRPTPSAGGDVLKTLATHPLLEEARRKSAPKTLPVPVDEGTRPITGRASTPAPVPVEGTRPITARAPRPAAPAAPVVGDEAGAAAVEQASKSSPPTDGGVPAGGKGRRSWLWAGAVAVVAIAAALVVPREPRPAAPADSSAATSSEQERPVSNAAEAPPDPAPVAEPAPSPPASDSPPERAQPAAEVRDGTLHVGALPWAVVSVAGRDLGTTPLKGIKLPAGKHTLTVDCPPLARHIQVPIVIREGQATRVVADLQSDPPDVQVR